MKPMVYRDGASGVIFYFERDGHRVSAIDPNGVLLWDRDPTEQASRRALGRDGKPRRPVITSAGPASEQDREDMRTAGRGGQFIAIGMDRESGVLDVKTGEYHSTGGD